MGLRTAVRAFVLAAVVSGCSSTDAPAPEANPPQLAPPAGESPPPVEPPAPPSEPPPPVAEQCAALGAQCGAVRRGTEGGSLSCGSCGPDEGCGIAGEENRCAKAPRVARTAWLYTTEDFIGDVAAHPEGGLAFMRQTPGGSAPARLDAEGRLLWARQGVSAREGLLGLSVSPAGELYAWGWVDGGNTTGSNRAVRYTRDGKSRVVVGGCGDECGIDAFLEDAQGGMLRSWTSLGNTHVHYVRADGSGWRLDDLLEDAPSASPFELYDQALLDSGDAFVSAGLLGRVTYWDRDFGVPGEERHAVLKIAPDGSLRWAYETPAIDGPGYGLGVIAIPDGSVFGFGVYRGALEWEGFQLPTAEPDADSLFLFALSPAGKLQWVRALPASRFAIGTRGQLGVLTVLPQLAEGSCAAHQVAVYARSGELEWARTLTNVGCRGQLSVDSVTFVGKDLVLAGYFSGEVDLGTGPLRAPEERPRGFLLGLRSP